MFKKLPLPFIFLLALINLGYLSLFTYSFINNGSLLNLAAVGTFSTVEVANQTWYARHIDYFGKNHPDMITQYPAGYQTGTRHDIKQGDPLSLDWQQDWFVNPNYTAVIANPAPARALLTNSPFTTLGHNYHYGSHYNTSLTVSATGEYSFELKANDDGYVYIDNKLELASPGAVDSLNVLPLTKKVNLIAGKTYIIDIFYASRDSKPSEFSFNFIEARPGDLAKITLKACGTTTNPIPCTKANWLVKYYDYQPTDPNMEPPQSDWGINLGAPLTVGTKSNPLFQDKYLKLATTATTTSFITTYNQTTNPPSADGFYPLDYINGVKVEDPVDPATNPGKHNFHFGARFNGKIKAARSGDYKYLVQSDDDFWLYFNGELKKDLPGIHDGNTPVPGILHLEAGVEYPIDLFFLERKTKSSALDFRFITPGVEILNCAPNLCDKNNAKPSVYMAWPTEGATLSGTEVMQAIVADNVGIKEAQFYVDGQPLGGAVAAKSAGTKTTQQCSGSERLFSAYAKELFDLSKSAEHTFISENSLKDWSMVDLPDRFFGSGDEFNLKVQIAAFQNSQCSLFAPVYYGADLFNKLNRDYLSNSEYQFNMPVPINLSMLDSDRKVSNHKVIVTDVYREPVQDEPNKTAYRMVFFDPNGPAIRDSLCYVFSDWDPQDASSVNCDYPTTINRDYLGSVPSMNARDGIEVSDLVDKLIRYCYPANGAPDTSPFCSALRPGGDRDKIKKRIKEDMVVFGNFPRIPTEGGTCAGITELVMRTSYLGDFVGERCLLSTDVQNLSLTVDTAALDKSVLSRKLANGNHQISVAVTDLNGNTTVSQVVNFTVLNVVPFPPKPIDAPLIIPGFSKPAPLNLSLKKPLTFKTGGATTINYCLANKTTSAANSCCNLTNTVCPGFPQVSSVLDPADWKAVDGNPQTFWCSKQRSGAGDTDWAYVDLGKTETVAKVVVLQATSTLGVGPYSCGQATDAQIQVSTDKITWTTVATKTGDTSALKTFAFTPTQARYVRFNATKIAGRNLSIREFEVWNTADAVSALSLNFNHGNLTSAPAATKPLIAPATTTPPAPTLVPAPTPQPISTQTTGDYLGPIITYGAGTTSHRVSLKFQNIKGKITTVSLLPNYNTCYGINLGSVNLCKPGEYAPNTTCQIYLQRTTSATENQRCILQVSYVRKDGNIQDKYYESFGPPNLEQIKEISDPRISSFLINFKELVAGVLWGW